MIDHYVKQNSGPTMVRAQSAQYHARELLKLLLEQARESDSSKGEFRARGVWCGGVSIGSSSPAAANGCDRLIASLNVTR